MATPGVATPAGVSHLRQSDLYDKTCSDLRGVVYRTHTRTLNGVHKTGLSTVYSGVQSQVHPECTHIYRFQLTHTEITVYSLNSSDSSLTELDLDFDLRQYTVIIWIQNGKTGH